MKFSLLSAIIALCATSPGCAPVLGVHVHRFSFHGKPFVHCTVVVEQHRSDLADQSVQVCKDAISEQIAPGAR